MMPQPPKPKSITLLLGYLNQTPHPTDVNIAILDVDDDDSTYPERSYAKVDTHLGIHTPDLPRLAREFREEYASLRRHYRQTIRDSTEEHYESTVTVISSSNSIVDTTSCLLLVCPDHSTAWADRRRALLLGNGTKNGAVTECALQKELDFSNLLFTQHSKAPSSWAHRKWVGKMLMDLTLKSTNNNDHDASNRLYEWATSEIDTCSRVAEKYPKNYHAWTHRIWTCRLLFGLWQGTGATGSNNKWKGHSSSNTTSHPLPATVVFTILKAEYSSLQKWMKTHVTDHSAVHYQGQILNMLLEVGMHPASDHLLHDEEASVWSWNLLSEAMENARSPQAQRFASYEVTWIQRRICGLAMLNYFLGKVIISQRDSCGSNLNIMDAFIQVEMKDLGTRYLASSNNCPKTRMYALSYVIWIGRQMKGLELCDGCHSNDLTNLMKEVVNALANEDKIVGNIWRIMNTRDAI